MTISPTFPGSDVYQAFESEATRQLGHRPLTRFVLTALVYSLPSTRYTRYVKLVARISHVQTARRAADGSAIPHAFESA